MKGFCRVAIDSPVLALDRPFDYRIPERMLGTVGVGSVVRVRLHGRGMRGFVVEMLDEPAVPSTSSVSALVSPEPLFTEDTVRTARWIARRYVAPLGTVLHAAVPGRFSAPSRGVAADAPQHPAPHPPGWLRSAARLTETVDGGGRAVALARTAGQTLDVAACAAAAAAAKGRGTLVITPRTALAEAVAGRIQGAVLVHGELSPARRARGWARARDGDATVAVAGRGGVLTPVRDLGLVVVVAAHDRLLKEERWPRVHAVVAALRRAADAGAAFVAVSAAPPLDLAGPNAGQYTWIEDADRAGTVRVEVSGPRPGPVTPRLLEVVRSAVSAGRDAVVFSSRRGMALRVRCDDCGWYPRCGRCGTGLTQFGRQDGPAMRCRACGAASAPPTRCPDCSGRNLDGVGWGIERVHAGLRDAGLHAPVLLVDADTPLPADRPRPAVIVGTQAVTGALWGSTAGAVCVADLDQLLGLPDFRAPERAFQALRELAFLLEPDGRFLVQTREPEHHVVQAFTRGSFRFFAARELPGRRSAQYPPFGSLIRAELAPGSVARLRDAVGAAGAEVIGPLDRPGGRAAVLVRGPRGLDLSEQLRAFQLANPDAEARIDVDPVDVL